MERIIENETQDQIQETVNNTLRLMKNLTSMTSRISAGDLSSSLSVLEKIVTVTNVTGLAIEKEVMYWNYLYYNFTHYLVLELKNCEKSAKKFPSLSTLYNCFDLFYSKVLINFCVKEIMILKSTCTCFRSMQQKLRTGEWHL